MCIPNRIRILKSNDKRIVYTCEQWVNSLTDFFNRAQNVTDNVHHLPRVTCSEHLKQVTN
jgi:hypothetical protein